jgi:hypothetical protein
LGGRTALSANVGGGEGVCVEGGGVAVLLEGVCVEGGGVAVLLDGGAMTGGAVSRSGVRTLLAA